MLLHSHIKICLKSNFIKNPDKSENYCFSYQWDTCLSLLAKSNIPEGYDPSFLVQIDLHCHRVKSAEYRRINPAFQFS